MFLSRWGFKTGLKLEESRSPLPTQTSSDYLEQLKAEPSQLMICLEQLLQQDLVIVAMNVIIDWAIFKQASDIHLVPQQSTTHLYYRLDGQMKEMGFLPSRFHRNLTTRLKVMAGLAVYREDIPQDGRIQLTSGQELRLAVIPSIEGEKLALRIFHYQARTLTQLGFSPTLFERLTACLQQFSSGLFLVSGPCGSGKTSTLYALLLSLKELYPGSNIVTIDDPVEQKIPGITQIEVSEAKGLTFSSGLRSILRQDPNIIMVGEIRDAETAKIAIQASLTGHLVLSSIHTGSCMETITRLLDMGLEPYQVNSALKGVFNQRLIRLFCQNCSGTGECLNCQQTGFAGRQAIGEFLEITPPVQQLILSKTSTSMLEQGVSSQQTLWSEGSQLVEAQRTSLEELKRVCHVQT